MTPPFQIPDSFEAFSRLTQADLRRMRDMEAAVHQLRTHVLTTIEQHLTEIVTRLEGGTLPDPSVLAQHADRLINTATNTETYSWRGTPILRVIYNTTNIPVNWSDYVSLTFLV